MNAASTSTTTATTTTVNLVPYQPPSWASGLGDPPTARVHLRDTNDPTPIEPFPLHLDHASSLCAGGAAGKFGSIEQILRAVCDNQVRIYLKRDDLSGLQVSGNKVRKLEFLFAHALLHGYDSVATVGCNQSNHCRTTAVAANRMRLPCHVILRTPEPLEPAAFALEGNVLLNKLAGASMHLVSRADYLSHGGARGVLDLLVARLRAQGHNPFPIPMGGTCALGCWGYLEAWNEIQQQLEHAALDVDHVFVSIGSGATAAGLALGAKLSGSAARVHAVGVCDSADIFHRDIDAILHDEMHIDDFRSRDILHLIEGFEGIGYALNTDHELAWLVRFARDNGVIFDPTYGLKGFIGTLHELTKEEYRGASVLFVHTGGVFSCFQAHLQERLNRISNDMAVGSIQTLSLS